MDKKSLSEFFVPEQEEKEIENSEEAVIVLHFQYGSKIYATLIDMVKEIMDFPLFIPLPHKTRFMGVFNLRGTIVPIFNPLAVSLSKEHQRLIVFEIEKGELVAIPATSIFKKEIEKEELLKDPDFVTIDNIPYEYFDMNDQLKEVA